MDGYHGVNFSGADFPVSRFSSLFLLRAPLLPLLLPLHLPLPTFYLSLSHLFLSLSSFFFIRLLLPSLPFFHRLPFLWGFLSLRLLLLLLSFIILLFLFFLVLLFFLFQPFLFLLRFLLIYVCLHFSVCPRLRLRLHFHPFLSYCSSYSSSLCSSFILRLILLSAVHLLFHV